MLTRLPAEECKLLRTSHENNTGKQSILVNKTCIHEYVEMQQQRKTEGKQYKRQMQLTKAEKMEGK